jgi:hypothetical protein
MIIDSIGKVPTLPSPALGLLQAVHDATVTSHAGGALPAVAAEQVFQNNSGAAVTLPAFASWPAQVVEIEGYAACDGRFWYPARRYKDTNSYYPDAFERTIYTLAFSPEALPLRTRFDLKRRFDFRLFSNNTDAVWNVVWEIGMRADQTSPAPIGPNLSGYTWLTPLIDQQIPLTGVAGRHDFGVSLYRDLNGVDEVWTADVSRYSKLLAAELAQLPTGNYFVLRLRLSCFDIENAIANPKGYAAYFCSDPSKES